MLTARQHQILDLIVRLYADHEVPIGSKTLLEESLLNVSPATIRNEMVVLEKNGFILKAHTSSGRIPSYQGYRYYIDRLITHEVADFQAEDYQADRAAVSQIFRNRPRDSFKMAKLVADLFVSLTGLPSLVFGQMNRPHHVAEFKLVPVSDYKLMAILLTDLGHIENRLIQIDRPVSQDEVNQILAILNSELMGASLEEAYQRLKLTIPMIMQRQLLTSIDFSPLVEKSIQQLKGTRYFVSGKNQLFDVYANYFSAHEYKQLFNLVDGSKELFDLFDQMQTGIQVLFGHEFAPEGMHQLSLVTGSFRQDQAKMTVAILGPSTMQFSRMIALMEQMMEEFNQ